MPANVYTSLANAVASPQQQATFIVHQSPYLQTLCLKCMLAQAIESL
jgi:hypothetical protein